MMANPRGKERLGFSIFRSRQQAARDKRFCITWINRMVNKEVEKRITELRSEFFLMSLDLFEMVDENHAQWLEAMVQILRESSLHHITVDRDWKTSSWLKQMEEGNREEEEDAEPLDRGPKRVPLKKMMLRTFSDVFTDGDTSESETSSSETSDVSPGGDSKTSSSETSDSSPNSDTSDSKTSGSETSDSFPNSDTNGSKTSGSKTSGSETSGSETSGSETSNSSPNSDTNGSKTSDSKISDSKTSDSKTSGSETSDVTPGGDTSSQPAELDQQENQTDTSQLMKKKEEKRISQNPFHQNPGSVTSGGEAERVLMNGTNEEEALLMEREWKEWMDEQEMRGNVKTVDQQNAGIQGGAAPPTPEKATKKKNVKGAGTVKKIKTYFGDLFSPHTYHKWERFEDED